MCYHVFVVINFQVLYGVDGVTAGAAPPVAPGDTVPDSYLRADQLTVAGASPPTIAASDPARTKPITVPSNDSDTP